MILELTPAFRSVGSKKAVVAVLVFLFVTACGSNPPSTPVDADWRPDFSSYKNFEDAQADLDLHYTKGVNATPLLDNLREGATRVVEALRPANWQSPDRYTGLFWLAPIEVYVYQFEFLVDVGNGRTNRWEYYVLTSETGDGLKYYFDGEVAIRFLDGDFNSRGMPFRFENLLDNASGAEAIASWAASSIGENPTPQELFPLVRAREPAAFPMSSLPGDENRCVMIRVTERGKKLRNYVSDSPNELPRMEGGYWFLRWIFDDQQQLKEFSTVKSDEGIRTCRAK